MVRGLASSLLKIAIPLLLLQSQPGFAADLSARATEAERTKLCLEAGVASVFSTADFPQSEMSVFQAESSPYSAWGAEIANQSKHWFETGAPISDIFSAVARERKNLQEKIEGKFKSEEFGTPRKQDSATFVFNWRSSELSQIKIKLRNLIGQRMGQVKGRPLGMTDVLAYAWNKYVSAQGQLIETSRVEFDADGRIVIRHRGAPLNQTVFHDVEERLSRLQSDTSLDLDFKKREFLAALFGYFNAMPYERGSAAIGRSVFTGIYASLFHQKPPIFPDAIDVEAMVMEQDQFVAKFLPELFKSAQN